MAVASLVIIIITIFISFRGFQNSIFFEQYKFRVDRVLGQKDYKRIFTSGFLHLGWMHLIFNMIALHAFGDALELYLGTAVFLFIYFLGIVGGNLFALFIHRNHSNYSAVGASGGVFAIIFAAIALFPGLDIRFFFIPFGIPSWLFGALFILASVWGMRSGAGNIGHDAHFAGAILGMLTAIAIQPQSLTENYIPILIVLIPSVIFLWMLVKQPQLLISGSKRNLEKHAFTVDHKYNLQKQKDQKELDRLLEKIHRKGINSLSAKEKGDLKRLSR